MGTGAVGFFGIEALAAAAGTPLAASMPFISMLCPAWPLAAPVARATVSLTSRQLASGAALYGF